MDGENLSVLPSSADITPVPAVHVANGTFGKTMVSWTLSSRSGAFQLTFPGLSREDAGALLIMTRPKAGAAFTVSFSARTGQPVLVTHFIRREASMNQNSWTVSLTLQARELTL